MSTRSDSLTLRNIAIIAHVDHGKTTLVDAILRQTGVFRPGQEVQERVLDSNPLERERGITILAKNTAVYYQPPGQDARVKINIVDTPGHADFGGEVERVLSMVDGCLLVVDAAEGPLPQTRYVLRKALGQGLHPIVVINKIDRADARPLEVYDEVLDLFIALGADDEQIDFPVLYASSRAGVASYDLDEAMRALRAGGGSILPLLDAITKHVPPAGARPSPAASPGESEAGSPTSGSASPGSGAAGSGAVDPAAEEPLRMMVSILDHDDYLGRIVIGRIHGGTIKAGQAVSYGRPGRALKQGRIAALFAFERLERVKVESAAAGEIVAVAGIADLEVGDTVTDPAWPVLLSPIAVDEPTLTVVFRVNDSPMAGRSGEYVTSRHLRERLLREARSNVALRVEETAEPDAFLVAGRGELHLGILIETMRRDGYEFAVSRPQVVMRQGPQGLEEPMEHVVVEVPSGLVGTTIEQLGARKAELVQMTQGDDDMTRLEFIVPARGLIGFHSQFLTETRGLGVLHHTFHGYAPYVGDLPGRTNGSLVAWEAGVVTAYALESVQERGRLFVEPGDEVYEGMIVGAHSRPQDLDVNVCKKKHVTNMRSSTAEIAVKLDPPVRFTVEQALAYIADDELVEVTPDRIRLRKAILDKHKRKSLAKRLAGASA